MRSHSPWSPTTLRALRRLGLVMAGLIGLGLAGCGHRRGAMRPVYVSPTAPCSPAGGSISVDTPVSDPGLSTDAIDATSSVDYLEPVPAPSASGGARNWNGTPSSPPAPDIPSDPGLSDELRGEGSTGRTRSTAPALPSAAPKSSLELNGPRDAGLKGASARPGRRLGASRLRAASFRDALRPFVVEPGDLFQPPKADRPWKYVVLHHSAHAEGGYDEIDREHRKVLGWEGCGYHFVIGNGTGSPDGRIEIAQRWLDQKSGIHCRNARLPDINEYGIGICLIGDFEKAPPTAKQLEATRALVGYLAEQYGIESERVGTHAKFAANPTACPGEQFPASGLLDPKPLAFRAD